MRDDTISDEVHAWHVRATRRRDSPSETSDVARIQDVLRGNTRTKAFRTRYGRYIAAAASRSDSITSRSLHRGLYLPEHRRLSTA